MYINKFVFTFLTVMILTGCNLTGSQIANESDNCIISGNMQTENVRPGLQRQILGYNDDIMLVKVTFGEEMVGQRPECHSHPHTQSSYVISGKFEFHCGDKVQILSAGDAYYVEPNTPHEAYCLEPGVIIDGFSPMREDFLK